MYVQNIHHSFELILQTANSLYVHPKPIFLQETLTFPIVSYTPSNVWKTNEDKSL